MNIRLIIIGFFLTVQPCLLFADTTTDSEKNRANRLEMVKDQIQARGISDTHVLDAMSRVPRHAFVPKGLRSRAYADHPLPIGEGQTISQPYIVALMTEKIGVEKDHHILEVGTGSGYQAAVLAEIAGTVHSIEIKKGLHERSNRTLKALGYKNVITRHGDGYFGWAEAAPFDAIMITAAVDHIPPPLLKQLKNNGKLVMPLGNPYGIQNLVLITKHDDDFIVKQITGVLFVPLTGHALAERTPSN